MIIKKFTTGALRTNTYVVHGEGSAVIIDPAYDLKAASDIKEYLRVVGDALRAVLLTHGHFDHCGGCALFDSVPTYIGGEDKTMASRASYYARFFGLTALDVPPDRLIAIENNLSPVGNNGFANPKDNTSPVNGNDAASPKGNISSVGNGDPLSSGDKTPNSKNSANGFSNSKDNTSSVNSNDTAGSKDNTVSVGNDNTAGSDADVFGRDSCLIGGETVFINAGGFSFEVLRTAGHTRGGVCYILGNNIFCGDTLFKQSVGRTDFEGGSDSDMRQSLSLLASLKGDFNLLCGHGDVSTLAWEKENNEFLSEFVYKTKDGQQ